MKGHERAAEALTRPVPDSWNRAGDPDRGGHDGPADRESVEQEVASGLRRRVLELEAEVRVVRAQLEVRNEAFRALMTRLVAVESGAHRPNGDLARIIAERDMAVELATVLQNMKVFRYTTWPRAVYGRLLRLRRRW